MKIKEINYDKLKNRIKEVLGTQSKFAIKMDLSEQAISNKLNNKIYFTQKEIIKACLILDINFKDIYEYFFTLHVRKREQNQVKGEK